MALQSTLFKDNAALQACLTQDPAHLTPGASGEHVAKVQFALFATDGLGIEKAELSGRRYGPSTAAAVLAYKTRRSIINHAYQSKPDDIVGKMTIAALDNEMLAKQGHAAPKQSSICGSDPSRAASRIMTGTLGFAAVDAQHSSRRDMLVGASPGFSPRDKALDRVGAATSAIKQTRGVLASLIHIATVPPPPPLPQGTLILFEKVWRNFGVPSPLPITSLGEFPPINTVGEFLSAIDSHYALMQSTLTQASSLFQNMDQAILGPSVFAWTLTKDRVKGDPPNLPVGIYFGDLFAGESMNHQTEIVIHEPGHFKDGHNFSDSVKPDSPTWGKLTGTIGILNSWSYSMFVLDVVFNRTTPFP